MNFDLPSSPPEMFFSAIRNEIPLDKEGGGSIAGGDINGPRNFSKEKINTSYYAPFALLLRSRANPSRLGTLARKFSSRSLLFRLLFHPWKRLETMIHGFRGGALLLRDNCTLEKCFIRDVLARIVLLSQRVPPCSRETLSIRGKISPRNLRPIFSSLLFYLVLLYLSKRYTPKMSSTSRSGLIRKGYPFPWIIAR